MKDHRGHLCLQIYITCFISFRYIGQNRKIVFNITNMAYQPREYMYKSSWPTCSPKYIDIKTLEFHHIHSIWLLVVTLPTSERSIKSQRIKMFRQGNISIIHTCKIWGKRGVSRESPVHNNLKHISHVMHLKLMQLQAFVKLFNGNRSHNLSPASQKQVTWEHSDSGSTWQGT